MRMIKKNKRAFTLVEMMLAVAIIIMTSGVFFSLIITVMKSHTNVAATNDVADFALLNAKAFENTVINAKEVGSGSNKIYVNANNQLSKNGTALFNLNQYKVEPDGNDKWAVDFSYTLDENGLCNYTIKLSDASTITMEGIVKYVYTYKGSVYIPHAKSTAASGSTFAYTDY